MLLVKRLCISCATYAEPMFLGMIFNSLHHDVVVSIELYVDQLRRLFIRGAAKRQLRVVNLTLSVDEANCCDLRKVNIDV